MTTKWNKYTYINTDTDALIEITKNNVSNEPLLNPLNNGTYVLLSVEDATIHPNNERKEMETTVEYNPTLLVTYKKIENHEVSYPTEKVTDIEFALDQGRRNSEAWRKLVNKVDDIKENIVEWYNPNYDKEEVLNALCELLDFTPVKTVTVNATVSVEVVVEVPVDQIEDFDAQQLLNDYLVIDYTDGGTVNSHYVEDVDVEW